MNYQHTYNLNSQKNKNNDNQEVKAEIILYTVKDIQKIFSCGIEKAYALVNARGFPSIRINRRILVPKDRLEKWINAYVGKKFEFIPTYDLSDVKCNMNRRYYR